MTNVKLSPRTESTVFEFLETAANLVHRYDRVLSFRGISYSEYRILNALAKNTLAGCSRVDLAHTVGLTPSAVTRALKPLEKIGYVTNSRNVRDARQSLAIITPAGLELLEDAQNIINDSLKSLPFNLLAAEAVAEFKLRLLDLR